jgi:hypothetical protein
VGKTGDVVKKLKNALTKEQSYNTGILFFDSNYITPFG